MAAITWANVLDHAPELSTVDTDAQTDILAHVNTTLIPDDWGGESSPKLKLARIYLAAHMGTMITQGATNKAGPVIAESADGLSRQYGWSSSTDSDALYDSTSYGKQFRTLLMTSIGRLPIVI